MRKTLAVIGIFMASVLTAGAQTGTWSGMLEVQGTKLSLVFHLDEDGPTMDSPDQGAKGIQIQVEHTATGGIIVRIPSIAATYEGFWLGKQIVGTFKQMGQSLPLSLFPGEVELRRPQTPVEPFPYSREEVTFANGDATLRGTLVLPEEWSRRTPVLIMVTGSGLQNRDEEIFEHKPFAVIADALARAGIASLRYDDRGFGESTGDVLGSTTEDFKNDALAGVRLLRERFDNVGVLGHSEGGSIALMLASEGQVDFVVSLAGAVVSGAETLLWQNRLTLVAAGIPETVADTYCDLLAKAFGAIVSGEPTPPTEGWDLPDALKRNYLAAAAQLRTPYMKCFLALDMRPLLGNISCPVLALNGSKDTQVEPESNLGALRSGLPPGPKNRIEVMDGLNHLFQHCTTGAFQEYKLIEETFAPEALELITSWILSMCQGSAT